MRERLSDALESRRIVRGPYASAHGDHFGAFYPIIEGREWLVMLSDGLGWEHASISGPKHPPSWRVMAALKAMIWEDEEAVMELHPPRSQYVNHHPNCLHLWRPNAPGVTIPLPPTILVGPLASEATP